MPHKDNYLSLDSNYKDAYGIPLLQMTYNFTDQDKALHKYINGSIGKYYEGNGCKNGRTW